VRTLGRTDLPEQQQTALRAAVRWEWFTMGFTVVTITLMAFILGGSQAMRTAWIEDMLSLLPQISFLLGLILVRRRPNKAFPFGYHRIMGVGHLVAGVALLGIGGSLATQSAIGLITGEHPAIGTVRIAGHTIWLGWIMVAFMALIAAVPPLYGRAKARLAQTLHNKVLAADADMAKADWTSNAATIVGVLGVGIGWWWLDGAAALFISLGIVRDGWTNSRGAIVDLMDQRARSTDDARVHPLAAECAARLRSLPWVADAAIRMRDMGQVFHIEAFVVPRRGRVTLSQLDHAHEQLVAADWKVQDVVVIPVRVLPAEATRALGER
jgi:divalent metal cation (Fe/Co/Zn/Cd) transporter